MNRIAFEAFAHSVGSETGNPANPGILSKKAADGAVRAPASHENYLGQIRRLVCWAINAKCLSKEKRGNEGTDSYMSFDVASAMPRISRPSAFRDTAQYQW